MELHKKAFQVVEDRQTGQREYDPEADHDASGHFACLLRCSKSSCGETCAVSGVYDTGVVYDQHDREVFYERGFPKSIVPSPPLIQIPEDCPKDVRSEVVRAFTLFWCDHASSLNRIRNALELVLTNLGVPNSFASAKKQQPGAPPPKKKVQRASLHQRIERLAKDKPKLREICVRMMAVKHLGNAGSHPGDVDIEDLFDGFDILEHVLVETYAMQTSVLAKMVKEINKRKGPRKKK